MARTGVWANVNLHHQLTTQYREGESILPEDAEVGDIENFKQEVDKIFDKMYPPFDPEIIHTLQKDYFLPALKVLSVKDGKYISPQKETEWVNMELRATCIQAIGFGPSYKYVQNPSGHVDIVELPYDEKHLHKAPHPECDCGVYGSVNLEEISGIIADQMNKAIQRTHYAEEIGDGLRLSAYADTRNSKPFSLCIIEPSPDADYILCRKGWKASHAFISEIIGQTMDFHQAEELLSYAWRRKISLRSIV